MNDGNMRPAEEYVDDFCYILSKRLSALPEEKLIAFEEYLDVLSHQDISMPSPCLARGDL